MSLFRLYGPYLDLAALGLVAIVFLFPRPGVTVQPALANASALELDHIAELQSELMSHPDDRERALALADIYLEQERPDWALATLGPLIAVHPNDARLRMTAALAFAERLDFGGANRLVRDADTACDQDPEHCGPADRARLEFLERAIGDVVAANASYAKDPNQVREILDRAFHRVEIPTPRHQAVRMHRLRPCVGCHPRLFFKQ